MVQEKRGRGRPRKDKGEVNMVEDNSIVEDNSTTETTDSVQEEIPMGSDPSLLYAGREEKSLEIIHAGQKWIFKYRELSWGQKNECIDLAQQWDQDAGFKFSVNKYYAAALTKMLTDTPIHPVTETTLNQLDRMIGEQLIGIVPQPVEQVDEIKKA